MTSWKVSKIIIARDRERLGCPRSFSSLLLTNPISSANPSSSRPQQPAKPPSYDPRGWTPLSWPASCGSYSADRPAKHQDELRHTGGTRPRPAMVRDVLSRDVTWLLGDPSRRRTGVCPTTDAGSSATTCSRRTVRRSSKRILWSRLVICVITSNGLGG